MEAAREPKGGRGCVVIAVSCEDERMILGHWVGYTGHEPVFVRSGEELIAEAHRQATLYVIVGAEFARNTGLELAGRASRRGAGVPTLLVVESVDDPGPGAIFDVGLDDYLARPLRADDFMGRILRRLRTASGAFPKVRVCGPFVIDCSSHRIRVKEGQVHLSPTEYALLVTMIDAAPRVATDEMLIAEVLEPTATTQDVKWLVGNMKRKKLQPLGLARRITRVRRCGYHIDLAVVPGESSLPQPEGAVAAASSRSPGLKKAPRESPKNPGRRSSRRKRAADT